MHDGSRVSDPKQSIACDQRSGQAEHATGEANAAGSGTDRLQTKHAENALGERTPIRRHRQRRRASPLFHESEGTRVLDGIATQCDGYIVAAMLAFSANAFVQPPYCRVIEEQSLHRNLENIDEGIKPLDVRQLVDDDRLQLFL